MSQKLRHITLLEGEYQSQVICVSGKDEAEAAGGSEVAEAKAVGFAGIDEITDADLEKIEVKQEAVCISQRSK